MKLQRPDPGIDAAKSGLHGKAGIFFNAGLLEKGEPRFDLQDLDPYLVFDSRESMLGTLENPTLDLDPATPSTLDVITATRLGVATYTDPDGLIATASPDTVRVDYTQGAELTPTKFQHFGQTEFDQWSHARTSETVNAITSPDGETNGAYFEQDTGNTNAGSIYKSFNAITGVYTASIYAKKKEKNFITFYDTNTVRTYFNLDTGAVGTVGSGHTAAIEDAGDGWFRCLVTFTASSGTLFGFYLADTDNSLVVTGGGGIYIYGPQVEEGTTASDFVANTTGSPKFITGATYGPRVPMILVEPSATNLVEYSEDFSFSGWTKTGANVANGISSPDGNNTAFKLTEDASASGHYLQKTITVSSATIYTASIFVKYQSREWIRFTDAESTNRVHFNTRTGQFGTVVGTVIDYSSTQFDDGWHRITITSTSAVTAYSMRIVLAESDNDIVYTGDGTSGIYVWGAQVETGSVATSYIPTSGSTVTRAADDLVISGSAFTDFFNGSEGTFYIEAVDRDVSGGDHAYLVGQGTSQFFLYKNNALASVNNYDGVNALGSTGLVSNQLFRAAASYKTGVSPAPSVKSLSSDGTTTTDEPYSDSFASTNILKIGSGYTNVFSGHYRRILYWPYSSDRL